MLRDHFNPPLSLRRHWHSFHHAWATYIAADLNRLLPEGYFAEPNIQFGIEIDVAALSDAGAAQGSMVRSWAVPAPTRSIPLPLLTDVVEVLVFQREAGPVLEGAIELVSPANKDRPAHRDAFVSKCAGLVQQGIGLLIVDVVSNKDANLHNDLLERLRPPEWIAMESRLYVCAYHPVERDGSPTLDYWQEPLALGESLPTMPLFLKGGFVLPVDFDATYGRTCEEQRIPG